MEGQPGQETPTAFDGPRQLYTPRRILLASFNAGAGGVGGDVVVRLTTPDARLIQKLTLIAIATQTAPGSVVLAGRGLTLWMATLEDDQVRGSRGTPVVDIVGTSAAPVTFPSNAALGGFSREFVTAADGVQVRVRIPVQAPGGTAGKLYAQARFQPAAFRLMPWEEWDEVRRSCSLELTSEALVVP